MKKILLTILRLIIEFVVLFVIYGILSSEVIFKDGEGIISFTLPAIITIVVVAGIYLLSERFIDKRSWGELLSVSKIPGLFKGLLVGALYMSMTIGIIALFGCYTIDSCNFEWQEMYRWLVIFLVVGIGEEVLFRGILYKRIASISNPYVALVISGLIFGLVHIGNENATLWSSIAIALEAGTLLAASYMWSKNLLFPIGIHWAWNFVQGYVYGAAVSGNNVFPLVESTFSGNEYITGGSFGPEASVIAVVLGILFTCYFVWDAGKKKA